MGYPKLRKTSRWEVKKLAKVYHWVYRILRIPSGYLNSYGKWPLIDDKLDDLPIKDGDFP